MPAWRITLPSYLLGGHCILQAVIEAFDCQMDCVSKLRDGHWNSPEDSWYSKEKVTLGLKEVSMYDLSRD